MIAVTIVMIWCVCIGLCVAFYFLEREIKMLQEHFVPKEEYRRKVTSLERAIMLCADGIDKKGKKK